jgi:hypothetical protein
MIKLFFTILTVISVTSIKGQIIATIQMDKPVEGICDNNKVYALFSAFKDQSEAVCPLSKEEILKKVNENVTFIQADKKYKDNCGVRFLINCKGEVVRFEVNNHTKLEELGAHLDKALRPVTGWKPGKLHDTDVDSEFTFLFKVKKGQIVFE